MANEGIIAHFTQIVTLLPEDDQRKIAFKKVIKTLEAQGETSIENLSKEELKKLPGIGRVSEKIISQFLQTGNSDYLIGLQQEPKNESHHDLKEELTKLFREISEKEKLRGKDAQGAVYLKASHAFSESKDEIDQNYDFTKFKFGRVTNNIIQSYIKRGRSDRFIASLLE